MSGPRPCIASEKAMYPTRIRASDHPLFPPAWEIYEKSFPHAEKRSLEGQYRVLARNAYHLDVWRDTNAVVIGLMGWWDFPGARYLEHYAIAPEARSGGYGSRILKEWMGNEDKRVILEIDPVVDEISRRRRAFYERLGFAENPMEHAQPPYRRHGLSQGERADKEEWIPLRVLSWPGPIDRAEYAAFRRVLETDVWKTGIP